MKKFSFKNIVFATLLLTSTANAYFGTKELSNLSDGELWDKSLHLALKTLSLAKEPQKKNLYAYNLFKLSVLSIEEERREFASPIFYSDPENYITFDVYAHLLSKYSSLISNTNPDLLDEIAKRYPGDSFLCLSTLNEFVTAIGLQKKSAGTFSPEKMKTKENNSPVVISTKEETDSQNFTDSLPLIFTQENALLIPEKEEEVLPEKLHAAKELQLQKEEDILQPSSLETTESDSENDTVIAPPKEENKSPLSKLTDVLKGRVANKKKRPPTLRGLKKTLFRKRLNLL